MNGKETSLDLISQKVLAFIRTKRPELISLVRIEPVTGANHSILVVEIPAPNPKLKHPLYITTENEEITWGFGGWHGHYAAVIEGQIAEVFSEIDDVFQDRVLAVTFLRDGKWAGGTLVREHEQVFSGLFEDFKGLVEVRSWTGVRDADIERA
jgi:hypothetical protein